MFPADDVSNDRDCTDVRDAAQVAAVERLEVGAVRLSQNLFDVLQTLKLMENSTFSQSYKDYST